MVHPSRKRYLNSLRKDADAKEREQAFAAANAVFDTAKIAEARLAQMAENRYGAQAEGNIDLKPSRTTVTQVSGRRVSTDVTRRQSLFALIAAAGEVEKLEILTGLSADEITELLDRDEFDQGTAEHIALSLNLPVDWLDSAGATVPEATKELFTKSVEELVTMMNEEQQMTDVAPVVTETAPAEVVSTGATADVVTTPQEQKVKKVSTLENDPDFALLNKLFAAIPKIKGVVNLGTKISIPTLGKISSGVSDNVLKADTYARIYAFLGLSAEELANDAHNGFEQVQKIVFDKTGINPIEGRKRGPKAKEEIQPAAQAPTQDVVVAKLSRKSVVDGVASNQGTLPLAIPAPAVEQIAQRPAASNPSTIPGIASFSASAEQPAIAQMVPVQPPLPAKPALPQAPEHRAWQEPWSGQLHAHLEISGPVGSASSDEFAMIAAVKKVVEAFNEGRLRPEIAARIFSMAADGR